MNARTAKMIRRHAAALRVSPLPTVHRHLSVRAAKRAWNATPRPARAGLRAALMLDLLKHAQQLNATAH